MKSLKTRNKIREAVKKLWENPEYKKHMSDAHKGQVTWASLNFKKGMTTNTGRTHFKEGTLDEQAPRWKGDKVGYIALHSWVRKRLGRPTKCSNDMNHKAKRYVWANISGEYKRELSDWHELCNSCNLTDGINKAERFNINAR